jgi:hypothetical protein
MPLYKNCSQVQIRWIHIYLYILQKLTKSYAQIDISDISFDELKKASRNLIAKKMALNLIEKIRMNKKIIKSDLQFLKIITNSINYKKIELIKHHYQFDKVLDKDFILGLCDDENKVLSELNKGFSIIKSISLGWYNKMYHVLETVSGISDKRNVINSGFTKDFPGFINLNINADPIIIGEQLAHETTHLLFENILYFDKKTTNYIRQIPPVFSVFAKKPRSSELVIHGLFSYTSVYVFWDALIPLFPSEKLRIQKRKKQVLEYINEAVGDLNNVLNRRDWIRIINIYKKICPIFNQNIWNTEISFKKVKINKSVLIQLQHHLNDIEIAELILAIEGNKVSRISIPINKVRDLIPIIHKLQIFYCFSNYIFSSKSDNQINDFQNVISSIYNLDTHFNEDIDIHIYFSNSKLKLKKSYVLDQSDQSASLFKTPKCCQNFFKKNWEYSVQKYKGDLSKLYFENTYNVIIKDNLLYNPIPMYFGLGFCWHFSCSLNCKKTFKLIDERIKILMKYKLIYNNLIRIKNYNLSYNLKNGYKLTHK